MGEFKAEAVDVDTDDGTCGRCIYCQHRLLFEAADRAADMIRSGQRKAGLAMLDAALDAAIEGMAFDEDDDGEEVVGDLKFMPVIGSA